jgi:CRP/FNR family transcriptional regulator, cyclic AMP receptor protein
MDQPGSADTVVTLDAVVTFVTTTALFAGLDAAESSEVVRIMEVQRFTDGEDVFREGDPGDAWFIVFDGNAKVLKQASGGAREIAVLERGAVFGEIAMLDGQPRSATVRAGGPLTVLRFRRSRFEELLEQGSLGAYKLVLSIARVLAQRHRQLTQQIAQLTPSTAKVTPAAQFQISE